VAFIGWAVVSLVPYLAVMRAIVGRSFGLLLALAFPVVFTNALVGQNGYLTASLIGGALYLMPTRPVLSGICLGLLSYKPQYGLLFPLALIAASQWKVFFTAGTVAILLASLSWLAFGTGCRCSRRPSSPKAARLGARCRASSRWCAISAGPSNWRGCSSGS
jgi:hypothetical protein